MIKFNNVVKFVKLQTFFNNNAQKYFSILQYSNAIHIMALALIFNRFVIVHNILLFIFYEYPRDPKDEEKQKAVK